MLLAVAATPCVWMGMGLCSKLLPQEVLIAPHYRLLSRNIRTKKLCSFILKSNKAIVKRALLCCITRKSLLLHYQVAASNDLPCIATPVAEINMFFYKHFTQKPLSHWLCKHIKSSGTTMQTWLHLLQQIFTVLSLACTQRQHCILQTWEEEKGTQCLMID